MDDNSVESNRSQESKPLVYLEDLTDEALRKMSDAEVQEAQYNSQIRLRIRRLESQEAIDRAHSSMPEEDFFSARLRAHAQARLDLLNRYRTNPKLTPQDEKLGVFIETIEPQVREAVLDLTDKGYKTSYSGFMNQDGDIQGMRCNLSPDEVIKQNLTDAGVRIEEDTFRGDVITTLTFTPRSFKLEDMKSEWSEITSLIPSKK